jgi:hypothetical protein
LFSKRSVPKEPETTSRGWPAWIARRKEDPEDPEDSEDSEDPKNTGEHSQISSVIKLVPKCKGQLFL